MSNVNPLQSVTGFAAEKTSTVVDYLNQKLSTKSDTGVIKIAAKYTVSTLVSTVGSAFHAVFAVASLVEAVFRHALAFTVKAATFIIPAGISQWIDSKVVTPLFKHGQLTLETAPRSAARVITNFLSEETKISADSKVSFNKLYDSKIFKGFYRFHWTGLSEESKKVETQNQEKAPTTGDLLDRVKVEESQPAETETVPATEKPAASPSIMKALFEKVKTAANAALEKTKEVTSKTATTLTGLSNSKKAFLALGTTALLVTVLYYKFGTTAANLNPMAANGICLPGEKNAVLAAQELARKAKLAANNAVCSPRIEPQILGSKTGQEPVSSHQFGEMYTAQNNRGLLSKLNPFAKTEQLPDITRAINKTALEAINKAANAQKGSALAELGFFQRTYQLVKENPVATTAGALVLSGFTYLVKKAIGS